MTVTLVMRTLFNSCLIVTLVLRALFVICLIVKFSDARSCCFVFGCYVISDARSVFCVFDC